MERAKSKRETKITDHDELEKAAKSGFATGAMADRALRTARELELKLRSFKY